MNSKTAQLCNEIQKKVISRLTGKPEFKSREEVIQEAVMAYHQSLKKGKIL
jgi:hypothetical protein